MARNDRRPSIGMYRGIRRWAVTYSAGLVLMQDNPTSSRPGGMTIGSTAKLSHHWSGWPALTPAELPAYSVMTRHARSCWCSPTGHRRSSPPCATSPPQPGRGHQPVHRVDPHRLGGSARDAVRDDSYRRYGLALGPRVQVDPAGELPPVAASALTGGAPRFPGGVGRSPSPLPAGVGLRLAAVESAAAHRTDAPKGALGEPRLHQPPPAGA